MRLLQWIVDHLAPVVTFLAILVALFKEDIVKWWRRPKLTVRLFLRPPDAHVVHTTVMWQGPGDQQPRRWEGPVYYFRLWIENKSSWAADRVQVYVRAIYNRLGDTRLQDVREWLPMNLRWSNSPFDKPITFEMLNPHMGKHCDLGSVSHPSNTSEQQLTGMKEGERTFNLATEVFPNSNCHRLTAGKYRIEILVAAQNAKPKVFNVDLDWNGTFEDSQERMFGAVVISVSEGKL
jgi:hypothetical protein